MKSSDMVIFRENDAEFQLTVRLNGEPYPLTGCMLHLYIKRSVTEHNDDAVIHKYSGAGISIGDATGIVTITIDSIDTVGLEIGKNFVYDIELIDGTKQWTILRGIFRLRQN